MFEWEGKQYELKFSLERIKMIENATGKPIVTEIAQNDGILSTNSLELCLALALKEYGADVFYPTKKGIKIADDMLMQNGYSAVAGLVFKALERDCPFLFR